MGLRPSIPGRITRHSSIAVRGLPENGSSQPTGNDRANAFPVSLSSKYDDSAYGCAISNGLKRLLGFFQRKDGRRERLCVEMTHVDHLDKSRDVGF